jgi:glutamine cyclotransferase
MAQKAAKLINPKTETMRLRGKSRMSIKATNRHTNNSAPVSKRPAIKFILIGVVFISGVAGLNFACSGPAATEKPGPANANQTTVATQARKDAYDIVGITPHDPDAFLQGLVWYDGGFYEGTGLEGRSTLRRVEYPSGKVVKSINLTPDLFGEGVAQVGDQLMQLTWKSKRGFVYDRESFRLLREFTYDTEGWGLTYDGTNLILSDGSSMLSFIDPQTFKLIRKLPVIMNGHPIDQLNELEYIEGEIWSNVWQTNYILRIDPTTGQVKSYFDMTGLLQHPTGHEDVLNGIAYDPQTKRIFVSGKLWPNIYEIKVRGR